LVSTRRFQWIAVAALGTGFAGLTSAEPILALSAADRQAIEQVAGDGLIETALPAPYLADPSRFLHQTAAPRTFRVRDGDGAESEESHRWEPSGSAWRYLGGDSEIGFVEREPDGSYVVSGIEDRREKALTRYAPAEPLLLSGMAPGEERQRRMEVRVFDPADPKTITHRGSLNVSHRYLGAYRINTPSGAYDTILTKSVFDGSVGPAHLLDIQYRFFAEGVGLVATVEARDVTAAVVYHSEMRVARMLSAAPQQQAECSGQIAAKPEPPSRVC
jgi:hypothetical protein